MSDPDYSPAYQDEYQRLWHEAAARAEAAEAERDEWKQAASGRTVSCSNCETTEAEIVRLREALAQWQSVAPTHRGECQFLTSDLDGCTCGVIGLDEARRMTRAALAAPTKEEEAWDNTLLDGLEGT